MTPNQGASRPIKLKAHLAKKMGFSYYLWCGSMTLDKDFRPGVAPKFFLTSDWPAAARGRPAHLPAGCLGGFRLEGLESAPQPLGVSLGIGGIPHRACQQLLIRTDEYIERLRGIAEVLRLQRCKFIAHRADGFFTSVAGGEDELLVIGKHFAVVHIQRDEYIIIADQCFHAGFWPNILFHLPAIDAGPAGEVHEDGLVLRLCELQGFVEIVDHVGFDAFSGSRPAIEAIG